MKIGTQKAQTNPKPALRAGSFPGIGLGFVWVLTEGFTGFEMELLDLFYNLGP